MPVVGHLFKTMRDLHAFLTKNEAEHGPMFWIDSGFGAWHIVVGGEGALDCLKNKTTRFDAFPDFAAYMVDDTLVAADGASHKRMRGAMNMPFTPGG
jgi:cytochrome P450